MATIRIILLLISLLSFCWTAGQVTVVPADYSGSSQDVRDLMDATIISPANEKQVAISLIIVQAGDTAAHFLTTRFFLRKGINRIQGRNFFIDTVASQLYNKRYGDYFSNHQQFPDGEYTIHWALTTENTEPLASFSKQYTASNILQLEKITDTVFNENVYRWHMAGAMMNDSFFTARISFYQLKRGRYKEVFADTLTSSFFSPQQLLEDVLGKKKKGVYVFSLNLLYKSIPIGHTAKTSVHGLTPISVNYEATSPSLFNSPLKKEKTYWRNQYKLPPIKKEPPIKFSGSILSESGYSNIKYPYQITPASYSRLFFTPTLTLYNIPISARLLLSTENSTLYPVNSFTVGLNTYQLQQNFSKKLKQVQELEEEIWQNMQKDYLETGNYLEELESRKKEYETKLKQFDENGRKKLSPTIPAIDTLLNLVPAIGVDSAALADSLMSKAYKDSVEDVAQYYKLLEKYNKTIYQYEKTRKKLDRLKRFSELNGDSLTNAAQAGITDSIGEQLPVKENKSNFEKLLMSVRSFDIGIAYPVLSEVTYKGLALKGLSTSLVLDNHFVSLAAGKTLRINAPGYTNARLLPEFERKTVMAKAGWGKLDGNHLFVSTLQMKDPDEYVRVDSATVIGPKENRVFSFGGNLLVLTKIKLEAEIASSAFYERNTTAPETVSSSIYSASFSTNKAMVVKGSYQYSKNTSVSLGWRKIGAGYVSLGVPFLRKDFAETEAKLQHSMWNKKITVSAFYKLNTDNQSQLKSYRNTIKGYGFTLKTRFRKAPNVVITHTPFEINSEFRPGEFLPNTVTVPNVVNKFHLTTANVFYLFMIKQASVVVNLGYLNNVIQNAGGQKFSQQSYTATVNTTLPKGNTITMMAGIYKTTPVVDTLNIRFMESGISFYLLKKLNTAAGLGYHQNNPQMFKYGGFIQASTTYKRFSFSLRLLYNKLQGNWMVNANKEIGATCSVMYGW